MEGPRLTIQAVLFDFDGTVADTMPIILPAFQEVLWEATGKRPTPEEVVATFGPPEGEIFRRLLGDPERAQQVEARYRELYARWHAEKAVRSPELEGLLRDLRARGVRLGVVTGKGRASADISLAELQLGEVFQVVITGDDVIHPKPHPEGLQVAMARLGLAPEQCLYVGDADMDVEAARRAGATAIGAAWFRGTGQGFTIRPDHLFSDVQSFRAYLEEVLAS